jgi:outer membrane biosynthesis protein TonB
MARRTKRATRARRALGAVVLCAIGALAWSFASGRTSRGARNAHSRLTPATGSGASAAFEQLGRTQKSDTSAQIGAVPAPPPAQPDAAAREEPKLPPEPGEDLPSAARTSDTKPRDLSNEGLGSQSVKSRTPSGAKPASATAVGRDEASGASGLTAAESAPTGKPGSKIDSQAADEALAEAAENARSCKGATSPSGVARVSVTFTSTGQVTSALVLGAPFGSTLEGNCIAAKFRAARIPPFSGADVTLRRSVELQ